MPFRLRLVANPTPSTCHSSDDTDISNYWEVEAKTISLTAILLLSDPFKSLRDSSEQAENDVKWFLGSYASNPFEAAKAEHAQELLTNYGRQLALQITKTGLIPKTGDVYLDIESQEIYIDAQTVARSKTIQQLYWEVLEDPKLWPSEYNLNRISVARHITRKTDSQTVRLPFKDDTFRILLVVSRLGKQDDTDHQIVSRSVVAIIDHVRKTRPDADISLMILRPPTWEAFQRELQRHKYDLVHFDMKGRIRKSKGYTSAVLEFVKPHHIDSLTMVKDYRTGGEIGQALASAKVKIVILNACESAGFDAASQDTNLAQVLLHHGIDHVLAMAYKVMDEAVEISMNAFYQSLLVDGASLQLAATTARRSLLENAERRANYMYKVHILDYIVPIFYTSGADNAAEDIETFDVKSGSISKSEALALRNPPVNPYVAENQFLIGRDMDILSLEYLLHTTHLVLLHGQGGCGKSELLRHICHWWKDSGWILDSIYIDFSTSITLDWNDLVNKIGRQLGIPMEKMSETAILEMIRHGRYLLVLDSVDAFESPLTIEHPIYADSLATHLRLFIDKITGAESIVIISSRLPSTQIANITSAQQRFQLHGLSIIESVNLLQQCVFGDANKPPATYHHSENIDFLRRIAILLEGNPTAIQMVTTEFKRVNYVGELLFNSILYGAVEDIVHGEYDKSRFGVSVAMAISLPSFIDFDETLIQTLHFASFWTIMPKDLTTYYWFLYISASKYFKEGTYANWVSPELQGYMKDGQMARKLRVHWSGIEAKLIALGILSNATVTCQDGTKLACYHVNPVYTLLARSSYPKHMWHEAKFAYIRQSLLWNVPVEMNKIITSEWASIEWDGVEQHNDHIHTGYVQALGWALNEGDPQEQIKRTGLSLFHLAYGQTVGCWWTRPRPARLVLPHLRQHLLYCHMVVEFLRPQLIPTISDLDSILSCSWALYQIEVGDTMQSTKGPIVRQALQAMDRWKKASQSSDTEVQSPNEVTWFQLRFAEAALMDRAQYPREAKLLFERNLACDPVTSNQGLINIIRRWHLQNLFAWANCVKRLALEDGRLSLQDDRDSYQGVSNLLKSKGIRETLSNIVSENAEVIETMDTSNAIEFALQIEREAVPKFGKLATEIINSPVMNVFADAQKITGESHLDMLQRMLASKKVPGVDAEEVISQLQDLESYCHYMAGDANAAMKVVGVSMKRGSPSSITSPGWERLAELHMYQYGIAISSKESPDFKRALRHMEEWHKLHQGVGIWPQDYVWGLIKLGECYDKLGRVADAGRSVIKCVQVGQKMRPEDCMDGNVRAAREFIHSNVAKVQCLDIFLDPEIIILKSPNLATLSLEERLQLHQIVTIAHEFKKGQDKARRVLQQYTDLMSRV